MLHLRLASLFTLVGALAVLPVWNQPARSGQATAQPTGKYTKKGSRADTVRATLASFGLPNLEGKWYSVGPFDNTENVGFDAEYAPEKGVDLKASYTGKDNKKIAWTEYRAFTPGRVMDLMRLFPNDRLDGVVYLYHTFESPKSFKLPLSFGSDDTLSVFVNGKRVLHEDHRRAVSPDQDFADVDIKQGKNELLIKIGQLAGEWAMYVNPEVPGELPVEVRKKIDSDFAPSAGVDSTTNSSGEAAYYRVTTIPLPKDCVLEVGGLGFRPDGKLLACTRRGEVWLVNNPLATNLEEIKLTKLATGLHEALGLWVQDDNTVYVVQRPELTKLVDRNGDGMADEFETICDKWGVSGDYHEFAFGPARDKNGNFFITLNVGFGGGHQAKAPWRSWCVKVTPDGKMEPWAYGLRSPNGVNFSPDGELFYADNQGEWVATNKLQHIKKGSFYGHQSGLRWVKDSPFAGKVPERVASGMWYDGTLPSQRRWADVGRYITWLRPTPVYPDVDPPCIWFPYGRMGKSASEPVWDTTGGKFGPFAGQCFVGDQTNSCVMRVALEQVNGVHQGACLPFRNGLQCGVNRIAFAPDGSMFVGQTNRGWGSLGGKPYGLQRIVYEGKVPFEIHHVTLTKNGYDLVFTKPIDPKSVASTKDTKPVSVASHTYVYFSNYGCPETDTRFETIGQASLSNDGLTLSVPVEGMKKGRVYEIRVDGIIATTGEKVLHPEAYYTLNELR